MAKYRKVKISEKNTTPSTTPQSRRQKYFLVPMQRTEMSTSVTSPMRPSAATTQGFLKLFSRLRLHVEGDVYEQHGRKEQLEEYNMWKRSEKEIVGEVTQKTPLAVGKSQTSGGLSTNINVQEAKEFRVVIELKDMNDEIRDSLRPGMSATAVITTKTVKSVVAVPLQAVIEKKPDASPTPTIQGDSPSASSEKPKNIKGVYVLEDNKVKFVEVVTGITGESDIQIVSGLSEGQDVITGPSRVLNTLKEGTVVKKQVKKEGETPKT